MTCSHFFWKKVSHGGQNFITFLWYSYFAPILHNVSSFLWEIFSHFIWFYKWVTHQNVEQGQKALWSLHLKENPKKSFLFLLNNLFLNIDKKIEHKTYMLYCITSHFNCNYKKITLFDLWTIKVLEMHSKVVLKVKIFKKQLKS